MAGPAPPQDFVPEVNSQRLSLIKLRSPWCTFCQNREDRAMTELSTSVREGMNNLWQSQSLCDYTIQVEGQKFRVHKAFVAAVSDVLHAMLTVNMQESRKDSVELKALSASGVQALLTFIYTGKMDLTEDNVADVVAAASHLQVTSALTMCTQFLAGKVGTANCVDILNLSNMYSLSSDLSDSARYCIVENFDKVLREGHHLRMDVKDLTTVLKLDTFRFGPEVEVFRSIRDWIGYDPEHRIKHALEVIKCVRLPLISPTELRSVVAPTSFMTSEAECQKLLDEALSYHKLSVPDRINMATIQTKVRNDQFVVTFSGESQDHFPSPHCYALEETDWVQMPNMERTFQSPSLTVVNNFLIVCGGFRNKSMREITNECFIFDPRFLRWSTMPPMLSQRIHFPMVHHENDLFVIGGCKDMLEVPPHYYNTDVIERYSLKEKKWESFANTDDKLRKHSACILESKIYVGGGIDERLLSSNKLSCFEPASKTWSEKAPMRKVCFGHTMISLHGRIYMADPINREIDYYDPTLNQWTCMRITFMNLPAMAEVVHCSDVLYFVNGKLEFDEEMDDRDRVCMEVFPLRGRSAPCMEIAAYPEAVNSPLCCPLMVPWNTMRQARTVSKTPD